MSISTKDNRDNIIKDLQMEILPLRLQLEPPSLEAYKSDDEAITLYTGFTPYGLVAAAVMEPMNGITDGENIFRDNTLRARKLNESKQFLLVMKKLKLDVPFLDLTKHLVNDKEKFHASFTDIRNPVMIIDAYPIYIQKPGLYPNYFIGSISDKELTLRSGIDISPCSWDQFSRGWDQSSRGWVDIGRGWDQTSRGWDQSSRGWDDRSRG
ncbi:unnamed protein product [Didymodactylos carnosus]|uniref:Uncharacterized protein n=1 Tax=Didymodactylos carnosus TaxID=1234261 RepID=A0A815BUX2_9BILA|nr:unnamed protein product [Didymodactylos carnosus]CAF4065009.1 unnamed protein product [Didymodactylos carnosus]